MNSRGSGTRSRGSGADSRGSAARSRGAWTCFACSALGWRRSPAGRGLCGDHEEEALQPGGVGRASRRVLHGMTERALHGRLRCGESGGRIVRIVRVSISRAGRALSRLWRRIIPGYRRPNVRIYLVTHNRLGRRGSARVGSGAPRGRITEVDAAPGGSDIRSPLPARSGLSPRARTPLPIGLDNPSLQRRATDATRTSGLLPSERACCAEWPCHSNKATFGGEMPPVCPAQRPRQGARR